MAARPFTGAIVARVMLAQPSGHCHFDIIAIKFSHDIGSYGGKRN